MSKINEFVQSVKQQEQISSLDPVPIPPPLFSGGPVNQNLVKSPRNVLDNSEYVGCQKQTSPTLPKPVEVSSLDSASISPQLFRGDINSSETQSDNNDGGHKQMSPTIPQPMEVPICEILPKGSVFQVPPKSVHNKSDLMFSICLILSLKMTKVVPSECF